MNDGNFNSNLKFEDSFPTGKLSIIAGLPNRGKTDLLLNLLINRAVDCNQGAFLLSPELSSEQIVRNLLLLKANIPRSEFYFGNNKEEQLSKIEQAKSELQNVPIWIDDTMCIDIDALLAKMNETIMANTIKYVFIDRLDLVKVTNPTLKRLNDLCMVIDRLKNFSNDIGVGIITTFQLSKSSPFILQNGSINIPQLLRYEPFICADSFYLSDRIEFDYSSYLEKVPMYLSYSMNLWKSPNYKIEGI